MKEIYSEERYSIRYDNKKNKRTEHSDERCGQATWYGRESSGRRTASGERFRPSDLTAASWQFGFHQRVRVSNPKNGRSVVVRINDRGPAKGTRAIIDLSKGAFSKIAKLGKGRTRVCLEKVK